MYDVTLTQAQYNEMDWFVHRGYFPVEIIAMSDTTENPDGTVTLHIPEYVAWSLVQHREEDPHSLYTCMSDDLKRVWLDLENEIV